jgi:hypothetical protein
MLGDALNAGYGYLEVRCLGCDTHQTVALDVVRRKKATTPIYELERYMRKELLPASGPPVQAQPSSGAAINQDFRNRSAIDVVAGRALIRHPQALPIQHPTHRRRVLSPAKLNKSAEGLQEVLNHHIPYEVRMMRQTFAMLADGPACLWVNQVVINALIESFCLHARSLIEFFAGETTPADNTSAAKHFAKNGYQPCAVHGPSRELMGKLNGQIAHPSYSRTSTDDEKVSAKDRTVLMEFIEDELVRFSNDMKETYKQHWPSDMSSRSSGTGIAAKIDVHGPAGPTNQIGTISNWGTGPTLPAGPAEGTATFIYSTDPKPR